MGLAPVRRMLYLGSDSLLWLISFPAETQAQQQQQQQKQQQQQHADDGAHVGAGSPPCNIPHHSHCELRLVPLIRRYFPSADSVLFQQLLDARTRQHPRYHFKCTQFLPPTAYIDPTAHYFDLERRETKKKDAEEIEGYEEVSSALTAPFLSQGQLYELLIENTERNLFDNEKELNAMVWAGMEGNCSVACGGAAAASGNHARITRVRPVPCAVMLLRYHGSPVVMRENSTTSLGLAGAVEALYTVSQRGDVMVMEEDGRSWLVWEVNDVKMSASVGGFYGCWTLDELLSSAAYDGAVASTHIAAAFSSALHSPIGPFGLSGDTLVVTGCVERDVGEREQPHAWMAACRAFASTIMDSCSRVSPYELKLQNHSVGCELQQVLFNPLSLLRHLDIAFVPQISNIPQLQLCRQVHLFMDALAELGSETPTVGRLQILQRERNNAPAPGYLRPPSVPINQNYVPAFTTSVVNGAGHIIMGPPPELARMDWNRARLDGPLPVYGDAPAAMLLPPLTALQEKGVCSYFADGAVVLRFSNSKVIEALQKLWCVPVTDTTESLMMTLTSRVPPQLVYRGQLRPPNPNAELAPKLPGVVRRKRPEIFEGLLLTQDYVQAQDVFAVGREFDGAPFSSLIAPALHGDEKGFINMRLSAMGSSPKGCVSTAWLRVPNMLVAFGDLIRCDPAAGCWCVDRSLRAEDVALSWMRRVAGKAREAKDVDSRWLRFQQLGRDLTDNMLDGDRPRIDYKNHIVRFGRFRSWHIQHDGYSYFHSIAVKGNAAVAGAAGYGDGGSSAYAYHDLDTYSSTSVLRATGKQRAIPPLPDSPLQFTTVDSDPKNRQNKERAMDDTTGLQAMLQQYSNLPGCRQPPAMPQHPPKLPIFKHMTPGALAASASPNGASGGGVGGSMIGDMRDDTASVSMLVDAWGAADMERVPSTYSNSPIISSIMHYTPGVGLVGRSGFWENSFHQQQLVSLQQQQLQQQQQLPHPNQYVDPSALDWESPIPTLGKSRRSSNGSSATPAAGPVQRQSLPWTQSSVQGGFSPVLSAQPSSGFLPPPASPIAPSRSPLTRHMSPPPLLNSPAPYSVAKVPVLNHTCILNDDFNVMMSNMESPEYSGFGAASTVPECAVAAVAPPPMWKVPCVRKNNLPCGDARTTRPSDSHDLTMNSNYEGGTLSAGAVHQHDAEDNIMEAPYDVQQESSESCLSFSSVTQLTVRVYKDDRQEYRWNPYGITRSQSE